MPPMAPEITISPSQGENFVPEEVHVSVEALTAAAPAVAMAGSNLATGESYLDPDKSMELLKLAKALACAAQDL